MARLSQTTKTKQLTTTADVKSPSQDEIDAYKNKKQQEKVSKASVDASAEANKAKLPVSRLLSRATAVAETLAQHSDATTFFHNTVEMRKDMDYTSIRALKFMRKYLDKETMDNLPYPKSEPKDVSGTNQPDNFDLFKTTRLNVLGESVAHSTSFYMTVAEAMPDGKDATQFLHWIDMGEKDLKSAPPEYLDKGKVWYKSERAIHKQTLNTLLKAVRTAAHIHLQEQKISQCSDVVFEWYKDKETGEIARSPRPIWIMSKKEGIGSIKDWSVGQFLNWKITQRAMQEGTLARIKADSKSISQTAGPTTTTLSKARDVHNWTEEYENMNAIVSYLFEKPEFEQARWLQFNSSIHETDDAKYTAFKLRAYLNQAFSDAVFEDEVKQLVVARDKK